ncbi:MAG: MarR family winged helix-turn-helix transcriptional regulator [Acidimicrobiales bacterium]
MSPTSAGQRGRRAALVVEVGEQLSRLMASARATTTEAASRFHPDLPPAAFHVARWLLAFGPARTNEVARGVAIDRSAASRLIDGLRDAGLVRVVADPSDRRANSVGLTSSGRRHVTRALEWKGGVFHDRLAAWNPPDLAELARLLTKLNQR